jgi:hypothetical protein
MRFGIIWQGRCVGRCARLQESLLCMCAVAAAVLWTLAPQVRLCLCWPLLVRVHACVHVTCAGSRLERLPVCRRACIPRIALHNSCSGQREVLPARKGPREKRREIPHPIVLSPLREHCLFPSPYSFRSPLGRSPLGLPQLLLPTASSASPHLHLSVRTETSEYTNLAPSSEIQCALGGVPCSSPTLLRLRFRMLAK